MLLPFCYWRERATDPARGSSQTPPMLFSLPELTEKPGCVTIMNFGHEHDFMLSPVSTSSESLKVALDGLGNHPK